MAVLNKKITDKMRGAASQLSKEEKIALIVYEYPTGYSVVTAKRANPRTKIIEVYRNGQRSES